jgi:hypothetical protein
MTESKPQIGEIVHLNSGSPDLKVISFCEACKIVEVEWQANGELKRSRFPLACLR